VAEYLACPRCGNRVDEVDGEQMPLPGVMKQVATPGQWADRLVFIHCPHCGAVLGVVAPQDVRPQG
jgi:predicted RNA-binding Zn-ribbon protein involved in translation (DUF1610 family)